MTFQLFYRPGNYFIIAHVCKGEIRIFFKCNQITEILFKKRIKFSAHHACSKSND